MHRISRFDIEVSQFRVVINCRVAYLLSENVSIIIASKSQSKHYKLIAKYGQSSMNIKLQPAPSS
jgi:hypothetical protein